jgi:hypothetical protein
MSMNFKATSDSAKYEFMQVDSVFGAGYFQFVFQKTRKMSVKRHVLPQFFCVDSWPKKFGVSKICYDG